MLKSELKENQYIVTAMKQRCKIVWLNLNTMELMYITGNIRTTPLNKSILDYCNISADQTDNYKRTENFLK